MRERSKVSISPYPDSDKDETVDTLDRKDSRLELVSVDRIPQHSTNAETTYRIVTHARMVVDQSVLPETSQDNLALSKITTHCVNILANLWHSPQMDRVKAGIPTLDPSDSSIVGGVAAWLLWQRRRKDKGRSVESPNFVVSQGCSSVWDRFSEKWGIEMRKVTISLDSPIMDADSAMELCDENTVMVVAAMGLPATGLNDDTEALNAALNRLFRTTSLDIPIHVDAEVGGFVEPFLRPRTKWDFRLPRVVSISTASHRYGLAHPPLGWVVWRGMEHLPSEMKSNVDSLHYAISSYMELSNTLPSANILAQYYTYIRLGFDGYRATHHHSMEMAQYVASRLAETPQIRLISTTPQNPILVFSLPLADSEQPLVDLQKTILKHRWEVSIHRLPKGMGDHTAISITFHSDVSTSMADMLIDHIREWLE